MKIAALYILSFFILDKRDVNKFKVDNPTIQIKQINNNQQKLTLEITLTNNSADTVKYRSMSCSWQEYYRTNSKYWGIEINPCFKNGLTIEKISPNSSITKTISLVKRKGYHGKEDTVFKLGLNYLPTESKIKKRSEILWSNPIILFQDK